MFKNYLQVAIRSFLRNRFYSLINVIGLASGLIVAMFIFLWVRDEVRTDNFHRDSHKLFRIVSNLDFGDGQLLTWDITPGPLADAIRDNQPDAELVVRTMNNGSSLFQYGTQNFMERGIYADPDFFKIFSYPIIKGIDTPIGNKNSVAISEELATKLFGADDPIGKVVKVSRNYELEVKAVFRANGLPSSIKFDFVMPFEIYRAQRGDGFNWGNFDHPLYLKLTDPTKADAVIASINETAKKLNTDGQTDFYLQPLSDSYLYGHFENGKPSGGRIFYVRLFTVVAIFILVIACINFMNMATAKATLRAKEVGIRKVSGAQRPSLIGQFMGESVFISAISMTAAMILVVVLLPMFNHLVAKQISIQFSDPGLILAILSIVLISGVLAGIYPAFFLSGYKPAQVLKGNHSATGSGVSLRKMLVVFQFSLSVVLIAGSIVVYQQIEFIQTKNLGYTREGIINFNARGNLFKQFDAFKGEALKLSGVQSVARANSTLVQVDNQNGSVVWPGKPDNSNIFFRTVVADYDFIETMGLTIVDGRAFAKERNDTNNLVVSQRAVEVMGLQNPVGQRISQWGKEGTIVGVVQDFHGRSLHEAIDPMILLCRPDWTGRVFIRFEGEQTAQVLASLQSLYKRFELEYPFEYTFVDDDFEKLYNNEKIIGRLALSFTTIAIIISGLGLIGLAAFTTERKRKEIGIRKSLGATVHSLIGKLSGEFVKLSLLASVIGCPLAYYGADLFLENYSYRTQLSWSVFLVTSLLIIVMSLVIVIYQVLKAANANPVEALRDE